jgi:L-malate glycosyltransferase
VKSLSVLFFYDCLYPQSVGGVEHRNYEIARRLAARGHRVTLAGFGEAESAAAQGIDVVSLGPRQTLYSQDGKRKTSTGLRLAAAAARLPLTAFDIVETSNIPYAHLPVLSARCRARQAPLLVTWYEYWGRYWATYLGWRYPAYAAVERACVQLGTTAIAVSELTARRIGQAARRSVRVVPAGIPLERIRAIAERVQRGSGPPLVYAGRLLPDKRLHLLIEAVSRLRSIRVDDQGPLLAIIGDGPDRQRLLELATRLNVGDCIRFYGQLSSSDAVWSRMAESRLAILPSSREGFGMFALEALAIGLPVIYCESPESAVGEIVHDGIHGYQTKADARELAHVIDSLLADDGTMTRFSETAKAHVVKYDWANVAVVVESILEQLAERSSRR